MSAGGTLPVQVLVYDLDLGARCQLQDAPLQGLNLPVPDVAPVENMAFNILREHDVAVDER